MLNRHKLNKNSIRFLGGRNLKVEVKNKDFHYQLTFERKTIENVTLIVCGTILLKKLIKDWRKKR